MKKEDLFAAIGETDEEYLAESEETERKSYMGLWVLLAACLVLGLAVGIYRENAGLLSDGQGEEGTLPDSVNPTAVGQKEKIVLSEKSVNVRVTYMEDGAEENIGVTSADMALQEAEELILEMDTVIFQGEVIGIHNLRIDYGKETEYRARVHIQVDEVFRGELQVGDTLTVLLPCPIYSSGEQGIWVEDTDTVSAMREGMRGIFMLMEYEDDDVKGYGRAVLHLKDIADYHFYDGLQYAFLETEKGLVYSRSSYPEISPSMTLEEVKAFIRKMLEE